MQITRKEQKMKGDYSILDQIARIWNFRNKINIQDAESGPLVSGKTEDLKKFMELLRKEAKAAEREPRPLTQIISTKICSEATDYSLVDPEKVSFLCDKLTT